MPDYSAILCNNKNSWFNFYTINQMGKTLWQEKQNMWRVILNADM
jgi:hypothetical protein